jgi:glutamate-5-semialdehyde dehydrogenase
MIMLEYMGKNARQASHKLSQLTGEKKNQAIRLLADRIELGVDSILRANEADLEAARKAGLSPAMQERLMLNPTRMKGIANDLRSITELDDPVGEEFDAVALPNGLKVHKQRVPLGVIAVIYESRPNVTFDVVGLGIKSGNSVILRGGSEAFQTNYQVTQFIRQILAETEVPVDAVQFIDDPSRERVLELLKLHDYVDMVIPRGAAALHNFCRENSRIPVITGGIGICHLFVDSSADLKAALPVIRNAKIQRPTVCNALDTILVDRKIASDFLPQVVDLLSKDGVTFRADEEGFQILSPSFAEVTQPALEGDFDTEWLSLVLGIKVVSGLKEAIAHITAHSTAHSDGILTENAEHAARFITEVDSAAVYVNASTRFTDGSQLGLGAEVAISTQRLHARGPMGLRELTTYKWVIKGDYHVRT